MPPGQPALMGSRTSSVDGSSEGGRISTVLLPYALVLYAVPLISEVRRLGYNKGKLTAEPALVDGTWCLKLIYEGERPSRVPRRWHSHRVIVEASPAPPAPAQPGGAAKG